MLGTVVQEPRGPTHGSHPTLALPVVALKSPKTMSVFRERGERGTGLIRS